MFSKKFTSIYERKTQNLAEKNKKYVKHVVSLFVDASQSLVPNLQTNENSKNKSHRARWTDVHSLATDKIFSKHIYKHKQTSYWGSQLCLFIYFQSNVLHPMTDHPLFK